VPLRLALALALALCLAGCLVDEAPEPALESDDQALVGGQITHDHPAVGQLLEGADPVVAEQLCTATLIGCRTMLTAAHCVCPDDDKFNPACDQLATTGFLQHAGFVAVDRIAIDPRYSAEVEANSIYDVAVVHLDAPVVGVASLPLAELRGDATVATVVGFGVSDPAGGHGLKRSAELEVEACGGAERDEWHVCLGGPGAVCNGDSGGPVLIGGAIAGVTSYKNRERPCVTGGVAANVPASYAFVAAEAGADLGTCSAGATAGPAAVVEVVASIQAGDPYVKAIEVPVGTAELRIAINGTSAELTDADLLVQRGAPPTNESAACASIEEGSDGYCGFADPEPGTWYAMVAMGRGKSAEIQLTATLFGEGTTRAGDADHPDGVVLNGCSAGGRGGLLAIMLVVLVALRLRRR
jgi:hypothetical protein